MAEPGIGHGTMPVLDPRWNVNDRSWQHEDGFLPPSLIDTFSADTDEKLAPSFIGVVDMPSYSGI